MPDTIDCSDSLTEAIQLETVLMREFMIKEQELKTAVRHKDWNHLERLLVELRSLSSRITGMDDARVSALENLTAEMGLHDQTGVREILELLPAEKKQIIRKAMYAMKLAVVELQGITKGLECQVNTMAGSTEQIISMLFPHRRGKLYSREGNPRNSAGPMVLSRHL